MTSVVLVHGIRTSATMWRGQLASLEARGTPCRAVDLPGHGRRAGETFTLARCVEVIDEAVSSLPGPHVVVGHSLGSYASMHWAARTSRPAAALVLASCGTRPRGPALAGYVGVASMIGMLPDRGLALHTGMAHRFLGRGEAADVLAGGAALPAMVPALRAVAGADPVRDLAEIDAPVWFVNGALDHFRLEERLMLRAARSATLVIVRRAGHLVCLDQPVAFDEVVADVVQQAAA